MARKFENSKSSQGPRKLEKSKTFRFRVFGFSRPAATFRVSGFSGFRPGAPPRSHFIGVPRLAPPLGGGARGCNITPPGGMGILLADLNSKKSS